VWEERGSFCGSGLGIFQGYLRLTEPAEEPLVQRLILGAFGHVVGEIVQRVAVVHAHQQPQVQPFAVELSQQQPLCLRTGPEFLTRGAEPQGTRVEVPKLKRSHG